jgi:hypothetical protein
LGLKVDTGEDCKILTVEIHNTHIEKASKKRYAQKWNGQLISLQQKKLNIELTQK